MELWTAFLLGFVGSLHCAGMCGPLILALPSTGSSRASFASGRLLTNAGRITMYAILGVVFGLMGQTAALAGVQRWLSLAAGAAILTGALVSARFLSGASAVKLVFLLKSRLGILLRQRSYASAFGLGALNGLLPCGLVYVACVAAAATASLSRGIEYMLAFGLGTLPMMLCIGLFGRHLQSLLRFRFQASLIRLSLCVVGGLLILRGLALGIPYVSPGISNGHTDCPACQKLAVSVRQ